MAVTAKVRGVVWRANPNGSQTNPATKGRGDWWVSYFCAVRHHHREKVGPKALAREEHERLRTRVRRDNYCPKRAAVARVTVAEILAAVVADYEANGRSAVGEVERHRGARVSQTRQSGRARLPAAVHVSQPDRLANRRGAPAGVAPG
jgi:hypothetical protein